MRVPRGSNITLAWTLQGVETLTLLSKDGKELGKWSEPNIPGQWQVRAEAPATYTLIAGDRDGFRSEKQLSISVE